MGAGRGSGSDGPDRDRFLTVDPRFNVAVAITCVFTTVSLLSALALVLFGPHTPEAKDLVTVCSHAFSVGVGALFGLVGGKAAG